jgi:ferredoxin-like protein FixX
MASWGQMPHFGQRNSTFHLLLQQQQQQQQQQQLLCIFATPKALYSKSPTLIIEQY